MGEADALERTVWDGLVSGFLYGDDRQEALDQLERALELREAAQGPEHSDLIWTLSLKIEVLRREHAPEVTLEAAQVGERRLALRRLALTGAPGELLASLRELVRLYTFEDEVLDPARVRSLQGEIERFEVESGEQHGG
jgi:hypothetical protein